MKFKVGDKVKLNKKGKEICESYIEKSIPVCLEQCGMEKDVNAIFVVVSFIGNSYKLKLKDRELNCFILGNRLLPAYRWEAL